MVDNLLKLGLSDSLNISLTKRVFLDLSEAKKWWHLRLHGNHKLDLAFVTGKESRDGDLKRVLAFDSDESLTPLTIENYLKELFCDVHNPCEETPTNQESLILALVHSDTTIVYIQVDLGLVPPLSWSNTSARKEIQGEKEKFRRRRDQKLLREFKQLFPAKEEEVKISTPLSTIDLPSTSSTRSSYESDNARVDK